MLVQEGSVFLVFTYTCSWNFGASPPGGYYKSIAEGKNASSLHQRCMKSYSLRLRRKGSIANRRIEKLKKGKR